jgi:hypothetical protein
MAQFKRTRVVGVVIVLFGSAWSYAQNPVPSLSDPHFCDLWQGRIGVVNPGSSPKPQKSKQPPSRRPSSSPVKPVIQDFASPAPIDPDGVSSLTEPEIVAATGCLLALEEDTHDANFSGATWAGVSELFAFPTPINLAALYYISYLYTGNWKHGNAIALRGPGADASDMHGQYVTRQEAVHKAYASYRRWYEEVKRVGLARAREKKLDPLEGTGLWWY